MSHRSITRCDCCGKDISENPRNGVFKPDNQAYDLCSSCAWRMKEYFFRLRQGINQAIIKHRKKKKS